MQSVFLAVTSSEQSVTCLVPSPKGVLWDAGTSGGDTLVSITGPHRAEHQEPELCALPCLDGQVCSATPVAPHRVTGFQCVCLGKLPALCQEVK